MQSCLNQPLHAVAVSLAHVDTHDGLAHQSKLVSGRDGGKSEAGTEFKAGVYGGMKHRECTQVKPMYFLNRDAEQLGFLFVFLSFF